jgi:hypothetical protein
MITFLVTFLSALLVTGTGARARPGFLGRVHTLQAVTKEIMRRMIIINLAT